MKAAIVASHSSLVEISIAKTLERVGVDTWIVASDKARYEYRGSRIDWESHEKRLALPSILDNRLLRQWAPFPFIPNLSKTIRKLDADIVNVNEYNSLPTWVLSRGKRNWKTVLLQHGYGISQTRLPIRDTIYQSLARGTLMRHIDGFAALGLKARDFLQGLGAKNVAVIPVPIDDRHFDVTLPYEEREPIVLFVGKVDTSRRLQLLLHAMVEVRRKFTNTRLMVIGDKGDLSPAVARMDWVQYLGPVPHHEMPRYYNLAKVYADSVLREAGCGSTLEEALACGTPIVTTTESDFPFVWTDGSIGYVAKPDPRSLAKAIIESIRNDSKLHTRCRETAEREFSHLSVGRRYLRLFEQLLRDTR
jgi:glycosyltransferase involved in cell wall biosynthesis